MKYWVVLAAFLAMYANAGSDSNKTINTIGIQDGMAYYFTVKEGLSTSCSFNVVYVPMFTYL